MNTIFGFPLRDGIPSLDDVIHRDREKNKEEVKDRKLYIYPSQRPLTQEEIDNLYPD